MLKKTKQRNIIMFSMHPFHLVKKFIEVKFGLNTSSPKVTEYPYLPLKMTNIIKILMHL